MSQEKLLNYFNGEELPSSVWKGKYAYQDEQTPDDMHKRMAKEFARIEEKYQDLEKDEYDKTEGSSALILSEYGKDRQDLTEESIYNLFKDFQYIIPQGSVMAQLGVDNIGSLSNCFVIGQPYDSYGGIFQKDEEMAQLMKRRGGVGIDISTLRPEGAPTSNAAKTSTGAISFMHRFSNTTREVAQNGRRGALLCSMDVNHPDILEFIKIKRDLTKVTGANISIKLNDEFMKAVENDEDYILRFPCDVHVGDLDEYDHEPYNILQEEVEGEYFKKIKAREYWEEIIKSAHNVAEPGLIFTENHHEYSPDGVYDQYKGVTTNPCFRGDMKLLTSSGYQTFKSLENQECELINKNGDIVQGTVWCSGEKLIYKITTWNNTHIYCTADHEFMTTKGETIRALDLKGHRLMPFYSLNKEINEYVKLGFLQGDGNLTRLNSKDHLGLEVNIGEKDYEIGELFGIPKLDSGAIYLSGYNELLKQLKFDSSVLPERSLPKTFNLWDKKDQLMFFKGMYSANGSIITDQRIAYKTTSKDLADQMLDFLSFCGITAYVTTNKEKNVTFSNGQYLCKESYDINIHQFESVKIFAEKIGFVHTYKNEALENLILAKAPKVRQVQYHEKDKVYDFNLQDSTHWGIVEGVIAHNCGEIFMQPYDACRLIAVNLYSFVENPFTKEAKFNFDKFYELNYEAMRLSDDLIDLELQYINRIINKINNGDDNEPLLTESNLWNNIKKTASNSRRAGLGFTALGDTLAALGLKYDSDEALDMIEKIMHKKMESELDCTIDLAILRGPFEGWSRSNEFPLTINEDEIPSNRFYEFIKDTYPDQMKRMIEYGRRNVSWSTVAPTGTVSLLTQTTSGVEPLFLPFYMRRKKVNPNDENVRIDFTDDSGDNWQEFPVLHPKFKHWCIVEKDVYPDEIESEEELNNLFKESPWYGSTANDIDWIKRVEIQSIIQQYISHSISSCLIGDSHLISTNEGLVYLEDFGEELEGFSEIKGEYKTKNHEDDLVNIDEFYYNGEKETIKIELQNGNFIQGTPNHKLYVLDKNYTGIWKQLSDISKEDYIIGRKGLEFFGNSQKTIASIMGTPFSTNISGGSTKNIKIPKRVSKNLARLLGYLISDGSVSTNGISLSQVRNNVVEDFIEIVKSEFGLEATIIPDNRTENDLVSVVVNSRILRDFMYYLGLDKKCCDKTTPKIILQGAGRVQTAEYLKGLTLDGHISTENITVMTSCSYKLIKEILIILNQFGIEGNIIQVNTEGTERLFPNSDTPYKTKDAWAIYCNKINSKLFFQYIGFAEERKTIEFSDKFNSTQVKWSGSPVPNFGIRESLKDIDIDFRSQKCKNFIRDYSSNYKSDLELSYDNILYLIDLGLGSHIPDIITDKTYMFNKVINIKKEDIPKKTYDLHIKNGNSYIVNNIVSHNTINLPSDVKEEEVGEIYMEAWKRGLKGITVNYMQHSVVTH